MTEYHYEECDTCGHRAWEHAIDSELAEVHKGSTITFYCLSHVPKDTPKLRTEDLRIRNNQGKAPRYLLD